MQIIAAKSKPEKHVEQIQMSMRDLEALAGKTILIVDDEVELVRSFAFTLRRVGFKVITARSGVDAFEKLESCRKNNAHPDLIITDSQVSGSAGDTFLAELDFLKMPIPVIALTRRYSGTVRTSIKMSCLPKPFSTDELLHHVYTLLLRPRPDSP